MASTEGYLEVVKELLKQKVEVEGKINEMAPIHCAALKGHVEVVRELAPVSLNVIRDKRDLLSPLHCAAACGKAEVVRELLARGARIDTEAVCTIAGGSPPYKQGRGVWYTPLHIASTAEVVRELVAGGADVNHRNNNDETPLFVTTSAEVVRELVTHGADMYLTNKEGRTALHHAARGHPAVVAELLRLGIDLHRVESMHGCTPLHEAIHNIECAQHLLAAGADIHTLHSERTPFRLAVDVGSSRMVRLQVQFGADPNERDAKGRTVLHQLACMMLHDHEGNIP
jgi:ankyrin repeat protein